MAKRGILFLPLLLISCGDFFGKKTDLSFIEVPQYDNTLIAYVPILPYWEGFQYPVDICVGYDDLYYVADSLAGEIVCLDEAGRRLGSFRLPGVHAVAQDRRLDLIAAAPADTVIGGQRYTLEALYRIRLRGASGYGIRHATIVSRSIHPFYFKSTFSTTDTLVRFRRIAVLGDNSYYVTRNGVDNDPTKFGGPDDAVIRFNSRDEWQEAIVVESATGSQADFFRKPWAIAGRARPPQSPFVSTAEGFWVGLTAPGLPLKVHSVVPREGEQGRFYEVEFRWVQGDSSLADGFLATPFRFERPEGIAFTGGAQPYLIIADGGKDSVYVFTLSGLEGVIPPPAAGSRRPVKVSFGGRGQGPLQMQRPTAVAHHKRILYVVDAGNRRIMRLRLTTDW
ncbi:MAG: hypothetical protein N2253_07990 [Bacteroidia bacterium]|nr:hypothetical protein [Bacteroidia bacterium]MCX7764814.1 hypothetical protein [Bacteroidia bacterium]MDW8057511.1 hypothetical protein [Bacteroidia bacterium]